MSVQKFRSTHGRQRSRNVQECVSVISAPKIGNTAQVALVPNRPAGQGAGTPGESGNKGADWPTWTSHHSAKESLRLKIELPRVSVYRSLLILGSSFFSGQRSAPENGKRNPL